MINESFKISNKDDLINIINNYKKILNNQLFIVSAAYDKIYRKYNIISLLTLILSSITTFIEAFKLTFKQFINDNDMKYININYINITFDISILLIGTIITILTSIVRFRNYRENLEKIKNIQNSLLNLKFRYNKMLEIINIYNLTNTLDEKIYKELNNKLIEINKDFREINVLELLRNRDIILFNKLKADFEIELENINIYKELKIKKINNKKNLELEKNRILLDNSINKLNNMNNSEYNISNINKLSSIDNFTRLYSVDINKI